jgi:membrane associated rhomboid family serine protease
MNGAKGGGTAFVAHVGGFVFGAAAAARFAGSRTGARIQQPQFGGA